MTSMIYIFLIVLLPLVVALVLPNFRVLGLYTLFAIVTFIALFAKLGPTPAHSVRLEGWLIQAEFLKAAAFFATLGIVSRALALCCDRNSAWRPVANFALPVAGIAGWLCFQLFWPEIARQNELAACRSKTYPIRIGGDAFRIIPHPDFTLFIPGTTRQSELRLDYEGDIWGLCDKAKASKGNLNFEALRISFGGSKSKIKDFCKSSHVTLWDNYCEDQPRVWQDQNARSQFPDWIGIYAASRFDPQDFARWNNNGSRHEKMPPLSTFELDTPAITPAGEHLTYTCEQSAEFKHYARCSATLIDASSDVAVSFGFHELMSRRPQMEERASTASAHAFRFIEGLRDNPSEK